MFPDVSDKFKGLFLTQVPQNMLEVAITIMKYETWAGGTPEWNVS